MIEHILNEIKVKHKEDLYREYVTLALQYIVYNTAEQEQRRIMKKSFSEIMNPITEDKKAVEDADRKAKEIIANFKHSAIFKE